MIFQSVETFERFLDKRKMMGIKLGLERMAYMCKQLGHPEKKNAFIHVAGTNGKGSTIRFMKEGLLSNGYDVGVFSSPSFHGLKGYYEINHQFVSEKNLLKSINKLMPIVAGMDEINLCPTEFEIITMLSFLVFQNHADYILIETGMGGREDTTNVVEPIISIITNISLDHQQFLGKSLEEIAQHKAGIIKQGTPLVLGQVSDEIYQVITEEANGKNVEIYRLNSEYAMVNSNFSSILSKEEVKFDLKMEGEHQLINAAQAYMALSVIFKEDTEFNWIACLNAINESFLPGRYEQVNNHPQLIIDSAHNIAAIEAFLDTLKQKKEQKKGVLLFAGFRDKALEEMLGLLACHFNEVFITSFENTRAAKKNDYEAFIDFQKVTWIENWKLWLKNTLNKNDENSTFYITGSLDFITKVREYLK